MQVFLMVFIQAVSAKTCEESVDEILKTELKPKIDSYISDFKGFDDLGHYDECSRPGYKYTMIQKIHNFQ